MKARRDLDFLKGSEDPFARNYIAGLNIYTFLLHYRRISTQFNIFRERESIYTQAWFVVFNWKNRITLIIRGFGIMKKFFLCFLVDSIPLATGNKEFSG
jgi:hypothetical protein